MNDGRVGIAGFLTFCRNNIPLVVSVTAALFLAYGVRLFSGAFGIDTDMMITDKSTFINVQLTSGRPGAALLMALRPFPFNHVAAFAAAFCLIWFFTLSWCYVIAFFDGNVGRNDKLIPFALVFMTSPVWAEQFYFVCQAVENTLIIALCPYVIYLFFRGFLYGEKGKAVCAATLLTFMISVYQAIIPMFCCGVCVCYMLMLERTDREPKRHFVLCMKFAAAIIVSFAAYLLIARVIVPAALGFESSDYVDNMNHWGSKPFVENVLQILLFCYMITVGHIQQIQEIVIPLIEHFARPSPRKIEVLVNASRSAGNIFLLPAAIAFWIKARAVMRDKISPKQRLYYALAGAGVPLCVMMLALAGGNIPPIRALYALPLAFAFFMYYVIRASRGRLVIAAVSVALAAAVVQTVTTARLFHADNVRFREDVRLVSDLGERIARVSPDGDLPVVFVGRYELAALRGRSLFRGQVIGQSLLDHTSSGGSPRSTTACALRLMKTLGISYSPPTDDALFDAALVKSAEVPPYPDPECVKIYDNFILIKVSDKMYE